MHLNQASKETWPSPWRVTSMENIEYFDSDSCQSQLSRILYISTPCRYDIWCSMLKTQKIYNIQTVVNIVHMYVCGQWTWSRCCHVFYHHKATVTRARQQRLWLPWWRMARDIVRLTSPWRIVTGLVNGGNLSLCVIVRDSSISIYWRP